MPTGHSGGGFTLCMKGQAWHECREPRCLRLLFLFHAAIEQSGDENSDPTQTHEQDGSDKH